MSWVNKKEKKAMLHSTEIFLTNFTLALEETEIDGMKIA